MTDTTRNSPVVYVRNDTAEQAVRARNLPTFAFVEALYDGNVIFWLDWVERFDEFRFPVFHFDVQGIKTYRALPISAFFERFSRDHIKQLDACFE